MVTTLSVFSRASLVAQRVKCLPAIRDTQVWSLGWEDLLEKEMATYSSILACKIPRTEKPGRLQSTGSQRVGHDWATSLSVTQSCPTLGDPMDYSTQASPSITNSQCLLKFKFIKSVMPSNYLILCHPFLLLPSVFPSTRVFSMSQFFASGGQSIGASASASVLLVLAIVFISIIAVSLIINNWYLASFYTISVVSPGSNTFLQTTIYFHGAWWIILVIFSQSSIL